MPTRLRSHDLSSVAERQVRTWALGIESLERLQKEKLAAAKAPSVHPYVTISREAGIDCVEIAHQIANQRGWKVFDRELLEYIAEQHNWSRIALECVDERTVSWFHETFGKWLDNQLVSQVEFVRKLGKVVLLAAQHESVVIVGRGAQFYLPREAGLAVRIIAPRKYRMERMMKRLNSDRQAAESRMDELDRGRAEFVQQYFHRDVAEPHLYDLVINLEHIRRDAAVDLILRGLEQRFGVD